MATVTSSQPWEQKQLNQSGIRRLKIVDADMLLVLNNWLIPQNDFIFYEFIFPSDLSCIASFGRQLKESGSPFWNQNISYALPHVSDMLVMWAAENAYKLWIVIAEDYNGITRAFGGSCEGLKMSFQATTGNGPRDTNPMSFAFSAEQLAPYIILPDYEDNILFPNGAGFSYGFSTGFNS